MFVGTDSEVKATHAEGHSNLQEASSSDKQ
jgi:hypothetical protein